MRRERAIDIGIALGVFALTLLLLAVPEEHTRDLDLPAILFAAAASLPLLERRRAPLLVFVVVTLASAALMLFDYPTGPPIGPTVALYFVAAAGAQVFGSTLLTVAVTVLMYALHVAAAGIRNGGLPGAEVVLGIPLWGAAWFAGDRTRLRRERMAELEERAVRAEREAERERRLAAAEERTRIARDLHDSAGHAINVILVQAGAARLLSEKAPAESRRALETIETVARETLTEIDALVRVLRDDEDGSVARPVGLAALEALAERHTAAGLAVELSLDGRRALAPAVDQAAYRIVQESLTNALLHGTGEVKVALTFEPNALRIAVTNPVSARAASGSGGHGIVGMRERAMLLGGSLEAGRENGVFSVRARLPL